MILCLDAVVTEEGYLFGVRDSWRIVAQLATSLFETAPRAVNPVCLSVRRVPISTGKDLGRAIGEDVLSTVRAGTGKGAG